MNNSDNERDDIHVLSGHAGPITALFIDKKSIYSGSKDWTLRIWSKKKWEQTQMLEHGGWVTNIFADNENIYTGGSDSKIRIFDIKSGKMQKILKSKRFSSINAIVTDKENVYVATNDRILRVFSKDTAEVIKTLKHIGFVQSLFVDKKNLFAGLSNGSIAIWDKNKWEIETNIYHSSIRSVTTIFVDKDFIYTGAQTIKVWDKKTKNLVKELKVKKGVNFVFADEYCIFGGGNKGVHAWNKETYEMLEIPKSISKISGVKFDDLHIYTACSDRNIYVSKHPFYDTVSSKGTKKKTTTKQKESIISSEKKESKKSKDYKVSEAIEKMKTMSYEEIVEFTKDDKRKTILKTLEEAKG